MSIQVYRMPKNPLVEVFGYPVGNMSEEAARHRDGKLCPYHNSSGVNCTKNSAINPLGVCTVIDHNSVAIICPVRLRQDNLIISNAAQFFFPAGQNYRVLTEVRLHDKHGKSAGNIDMVLVALDEKNEIIDFGALEVQAVYISGNISRAFHKYMVAPVQNYDMEWPSKGYPKADYLSSSRKRLAPQLIYKGGILNAWDKKIAVAVHHSFFDRLPKLEEVDVSEAEIAWFIYDLVFDSVSDRFKLVRTDTRYTKFKTALDTITNADPGDLSKFITYLRGRIQKAKLMGVPPETELPPTVAPLSEAFDVEFGQEESLDEFEDSDE
jgi:hypothetical protein